MKTPELKPCPFCGNKQPAIADLDEIYGARVFCKQCGTYGPYNDSLYAAIKLWNRRAEG